MANDLQYEDEVIRKIFAVALREQNVDAAANPPVIYLQNLAEASTQSQAQRQSCGRLASVLRGDFERGSCDSIDVTIQELKSDKSPLLLNKDTVDRAIMARLLDAPEQYPQWPLHYLIDCYGRATAEIRALSTLRDKEAANRIQLDIQYCKELIASNAGLLLTMSDSLFPQVLLHGQCA